MRIHERMSNEEIDVLVKEYFDIEGYTFPAHFEHRVDPNSSAILYSIVREYKPKSCLQIGTWEGGSVSVIQAALIKNKTSFNFVASELLDDKRHKTEKNCKEINGSVPIMIGDITKNLNKVPKMLDFLFHDSDHDDETTKWVFDNIIPRLKKGALVAFHDWAVTDANGEWKGKGDKGVGGWPETEYMLELHRQGIFPFEKVYWNYQNPGGEELGVFLKT